ncbi:MAG: right-handed parallel beta-helix repeat-containing protein [Carboxylicivirga sp.]|nr:right-handed parallel beta-helix repeat-containing protein [Carboxylicivirga sp.]MCT4643777.1 right-handed parallel beta-helix repeat-containing protein [Carboxylicivirga sp.]
MNSLHYFIVILLACIFIGCSNEIDIFVAMDGSDNATGRQQQPLATLSAALDKIKQIEPDKGPFTIYLMGGIYQLKETMVVDETFPENLTIRSWKGEEVRLSGGTHIDPRFVEPVKGSSYQHYFRNADVENIWMVDLKKIGIDNYGQLRNVGFARPYGAAWLELFINHQPGQLARWPNDSTVAMGEVLDEGSIPRQGDFSNRGGQFRFDVERPKEWKHSSDIWIAGYFRHGYADDAIRLAHIDTLNGIFTTDKPTLYGFGSGKPWNRWYAYNVLEELDRQGEYYLDREHGRLFFYAMKFPENIEVSLLDQALMALEGAKGVVVDGITFECARGMGIYMEMSEDCRIQNCHFRNLGSVAVCIGKGIEPFTDYLHEGSGRPVSRTIGSWQQHIYSNTLFNREAGFNNGIINCTITNTGAGGIHLGGGDRSTLKSGNNFVEYCKISNFNRLEKSYRAGVDISGVGNRISACEIYNAPSMAILLHGNDHLMEYNNIHNVCLEVDDQGALYYGRDPSEYGHIVRHNYFHHLGAEHRVTAVYHDDGACGMEVTGNIFYKAGTLSALIGGGLDNVYRNNLFIACPTAIHIDNRMQNWGKGMIDPEGIVDRRLKAVNYRQPPYSLAYPALVNYWERNPALPSGNRIENNRFVNIDLLVHGNQAWLDWRYDNKVYSFDLQGERWFRPLKPVLDSLKIPVDKIVGL